jgi:hypothetical protein
MAKVRVTLTLDEEVLNVYKTLAEATNVKLSPCINDWLSSTAPSFAVMTRDIEAIKQRPQEALNTLILFQEQMREGTLDPALVKVMTMTKVEEKDKDQATPGPGDREDGARTQTPTRPVTPHSNTGVNPPNSPFLGSK